MRTSLTSHLSSCCSVGVEFIPLVAETLRQPRGECYHLIPPHPPSTFSGMSPLLFSVGMQVYGCIVSRPCPMVSLFFCFAAVFLFCFSFGFCSLVFFACPLFVPLLVSYFHNHQNSVKNKTKTHTHTKKTTAYLICNIVLFFF